MKETAKPMDFISVCRDCRSKCCNGARPPLSKKRALIISQYLIEKRSNLSVHFRSYSHPEEDSDGYCTLFDREEGLCRAQEVKPETCVAGPITFDINRPKGVVEWYLKQEKICHLAGVMARSPTMLAKHLDVAKKEIMRLIEDLPRNELLAILKIEEEDTDKIGEDPLPTSVALKLWCLVEQIDQSRDNATIVVHRNS